LSASTTKPSGESGHGAPLTVAVNVTKLHAVDGFEDEFSAVLVGTPSANAGAAAIAPPPTNTAPNTATRSAQPLAFISIPSLDVAKEALHRSHDGRPEGDPGAPGVSLHNPPRRR
jgi:hypothetical protein